MPIHHTLQLIDIHTHTRREGVKSILSYSIGLDKEAPDGVFSAGVHPWSADMPPQELEKALDYLREAPVAAIGETGLDYIHSDGKEKQANVFTAQLQIAQERNLPVIIHCVKAYNDLQTILKDYILSAVILHGYIGSIDQTENLLESKVDYYFSFGERSFRSAKTVDSLRAVPTEKLFFETDMSPISILSIYEMGATARNTTVESIAAEINNNYDRIFG